ncbi:hypothetical protein MycrhDRAFT_2942 [Mycolicibacterium rhodesiae JS60]|nr:hypothetical protein MycrhDRAFT_2942 [Mycolicibacterium rhodesiae JS60]
MTDKLKVDVEGLIRGGSDVGEQATVLSTSHLQSVAGLSDAELGWVGASADALVGMAETWQQVADHHHTALMRQSAHVTEAARAFKSMDGRHSAELDQLD